MQGYANGIYTRDRTRTCRMLLKSDRIEQIRRLTVPAWPIFTATCNVAGATWRRQPFDAGASRRGRPRIAEDGQPWRGGRSSPRRRLFRLWIKGSSPRAFYLLCGADRTPSARVQPGRRSSVRPAASHHRVPLIRPPLSRPATARHHHGTSQHCIQQFSCCSWT
jgi:hypothetical protein